jgi:hypothetical protein
MSALRRRGEWLQAPVLNRSKAMKVAAHLIFEWSILNVSMVRDSRRRPVLRATNDGMVALSDRPQLQLHDLRRLLLSRGRRPRFPSVIGAREVPGTDRRTRAQEGDVGGGRAHRRSGDSLPGTRSLAVSP